MLQFFGPDEVVEELSKQVQPHGESQANHEENDALGQVQHVQHRIHPDTAKVTDHVQPPQIAGHKDAEPGEAGLARRILPEAGANLQDHKDHNVRVHHMVQPTVERKRKKLIKFKPHTKKKPSRLPREDRVQCLRKHQLPVDGHQRPEGHADVQRHRERERGQHVVLELPDEGSLAWGHLIGADKVVYETHREVDGLQDLRRGMDEVSLCNPVCL